jgi:hypothetical protein
METDNELREKWSTQVHALDAGAICCFLGRLSQLIWTMLKLLIPYLLQLCISMLSVPMHFLEPWFQHDTEIKKVNDGQSAIEVHKKLTLGCSWQ